MLMNICPFCERNNHDDVNVCRNCGRSLARFTGMSTLLVDDAGAIGGFSAPGSDYFGPKMSIILKLRNAQELITLPIENETTLGRVSPARTAHQPDVDLSYFKAYENGVSSRHARLEREAHHLILTDLGSTNGTFRNGQRLLPYQPAIIRSGDEIRLANLTVLLYFQEMSLTQP